MNNSRIDRAARKTLAIWLSRTTDGGLCPPSTRTELQLVCDANVAKLSMKAGDDTLRVYWTEIGYAFAAAPLSCPLV